MMSCWNDGKTDIFFLGFGWMVHNGLKNLEQKVGRGEYIYEDPC